MKITPFDFGYKSRFKFLEFGEEHSSFGLQQGENNTNALTNADLPDGEQGINEQNIDKEVAKLRPCATPLDTIMRNMKMRSMPTDSQEIKFYQQSNKPMFDSLATDGATSGSGSSSASAVKSYTASAPGIDFIYIKVTTPKVWRKKDTLLMRDLTVNKDDDGKLVISGTNTDTYDQMFYVEDKDGAALKLRPIGGMVGTGDNANAFIVPSFTADTVLYRMGSAMAEYDLQTEAFGIHPTPSVNYTQYFMCQIQQSTFEKMTNKEIAYDLTDQEADAIYDMRGEIESSYLWGTKYFFDGDDGRTYFCEGIARQINKVIEYGSGSGDTTLTDTQLMAIMKSVFTRNSGSRERVMFAGSGFIAALELFMLSSAHKQMQLNAEQTEFWGVKCTKLYNTFGEINVIQHPLFDETGRENEAMIFDPQFIKKHTFKPMSATDIDLKSSGQKNADVKTLSEVSCLTIRYPECHAIIKPKA